MLPCTFHIIIASLSLHWPPQQYKQNSSWYVRLLKVKLVYLLTLSHKFIWVAFFSAGKNQPALFDCWNNSDALEVKMDGSVLDEEYFKMQELRFAPKLHWVSYIASTERRSVKFLCSEVVLSLCSVLHEILLSYLAGAYYRYLDMLGKNKKRAVDRVVGPTLVLSLIFGLSPTCTQSKCIL